MLNPNFRFLVVTKLQYAPLSATVFSNMNVINFEVKQSGLEEQVLGIVLKTFDDKIE